MKLWLCSAKQLVRGEPNVSYICSRYYRAPELIFGATDYTSSIGKFELAFKTDFLDNKFSTVNAFVSFQLLS